MKKMNPTRRGLHCLILTCCLLAGGGVVEKAQAADELPIRVPRGFEATLFASEPMLKNPVALSVDADGTVYVTETQRRKAQNLDIRSNADWIDHELSLQTVGMKKAFYLSTLVPANSDANSRRVDDHNGDGVHDWKDLTVLSEFIHALRDHDGDGRADTSTVFAGNFQSPVTGVAGGVLAWNGDVYANVAPHVWKLTDTDGDGTADRRIPIAYGFASHIAYGGHNTHGATIGPDGRIYWSIGDTSSDYTPHEGAVFRCNPDGTGFEVFATGLRNPQEMAFDDYGNLFTGDNDADFGDRERWYCLVEGGDYGWRFWWQYQPGGRRWNAPDSDYSVWMEEKLWHEYFPGQAAFIIPAIKLIDNGPCGMTAYPGVGFGPEFRNSFFLAHFTGSAANSGVRHYKVEPQGAGFDLVEDTKFVTGAVITGVDFAPDGSGLYLSDWSGSWPLNSKGRVYRISDPVEGRSDIVRQSNRLLNGGIRTMDVDQLGVLLSHANRNVRREAQFELVRRGDAGLAILGGVAGSGKSQLARVHAIWGLDMIGRTNRAVLERIEKLVVDADPEIRAQAVKALGDNRWTPGIPSIRSLLSDQDQPSRVQFMCLMALGKLGDTESLDRALAILHGNGDSDLMLRHAGIMYLKGLKDHEIVAALSTHPSAHVRLAAVVALRKMENPHAALFLDDADPLVVLEAARAVNDVPLEPGRSRLAALIHREMDSEALARRVLNAHFRLGAAENARALAAYAALDRALPEGRIEALKMLRQWTTVTPRDRVCGGWFPLGYQSAQRSEADVRSALEGVLPDLLGGPEEVATLTVGIIEDLQLEVDEAQLSDWAVDENLSSELRLASINLMARRQSAGLQSAIRTVLSSPDASLRTRALVLLNDIDADSARRLMDDTLNGGSVRDRQLLLQSMGGLRGEFITTRLRRMLDAVESGQTARSLALDIVMAAAESDDAGLKKRATDLLEVGSRSPDASQKFHLEFCTEGGDPLAGRDVFINRVELACLRCHQVPDGSGDAIGGTMGPSLAGLASRAGDAYLVESILNPSAAFAEGFEMTTLTLRDGSSVSGRILKETGESILLELPVTETVDEFGIELDEAASAEPVRKSVPAASIVQRSEGLSAMPPGLHSLMTLREFRDLMAFLKSLR
jgi:putative membrane-bound dehydrogenase-like protein